MDQFYYVSSAGKISYTRRTGRNGLLLIHGFTASSEVWGRLLNFLDDSFDLIIVDLFGHGRSEMPKIRSENLRLNQLLDVQARSLMELLDYLGLQEYSVIGSSFGGLVAMRLALSELRPTRMVLIDSAGTIPKDDAKFGTGLNSVLDKNSSYNPSFPFQIDDILSVVSNDGVSVDDGFLGDIKVPVSVIWGSEDYIFDARWGKILSEKLPHSEFHRIEGANHTPFTSHPRLVADIINRFLLP